MHIYDTLRDLLLKAGLSEQEVYFYTGLLKNRGKPILDIARRLGISKSQAYLLVNTLEQKSLLKTEKRGIQKQITPLSLKSFSETMDRQSRKMGKVASGLLGVDKALRLMGDDMETHLETYYGEEVPEAYVNLSEEAWNYIFAIGAFEMYSTAVGMPVIWKFIQNRVRRSAKAKAIFSDEGPNIRELTKLNSLQHRLTTYLELEKFKNTYMYIMPETSKVGIWSKDETGNLQGTIIRSRHVVECHEALFKSLWSKVGIA